MKTKIKHLAIVGVLSLITALSYAQQDPMFTHFMFNTLSVNSGYAGSRNALTITGLTRHQWVGLDGAPTTQTLTAHTPLLHEKLGVGLSVVQDKIGPIKQSNFYGDFAYKIAAGKGKLAFGLKGGLSILQGNLTSLQLTDENDPNFSSNIQTRILPNFGFGVYYAQERFYAGASTPRMLRNTFVADTASGSNNLNKESRHFFLIAGSVFDIVGKNIQFKPTALVKIVGNAPVEFDLSGSLILKEKLSVGMMLRSGDGIGALIGYQFTDQLRAGYSYDQALTRLRAQNRGTHEIMVSYDFFFKDQGKVKSPRYF